MRAKVKAFKGGTTLAYVKGSPDTITDSGNGFITRGFAPGDTIFTYNATTAGNDLSAAQIVSVTAGILTLSTSNALAASEAFPAAGCIVDCQGGSYLELMKDGVLNCYTGAPPSDADQALSGTLVCQLTNLGGVFVPGQFTNGLQLDPPSGTGAIVNLPIAAGQTWQGAGLINPNGVMGYFRWIGNAADSGVLSTTAIRIQGSIGVGSSFDMNLTSNTLALGANLTLTAGGFTMTSS
jgi:hypothetical protein